MHRIVRLLRWRGPHTPSAAIPTHSHDRNDTNATKPKASLCVFVLCGLLFVGSWLALPALAEASRIDDLIRTLRKSRSYKVRLTAVLGISKYTSPQAIKALRRALRKRREHPYVRGFAALGLGRMKAHQSVRDLKRAARSRSRFLRNKARRALRMLCPARLRGKRFYISLAKVEVQGPLSGYARGLMMQQIQALLARRSDVTTVWPSCRKPSRRRLRRKRMSGYYLRLRLKIRYSGGSTRSKLSVLFTTYPRDAIKGSVSSTASAATTPGKSIVSRLMRVLTSSLRADINQFLNSR